MSLLIMLSIFANKIRLLFVPALLWFALFGTPLVVAAQSAESLSLTLTPPLFQVTQAPGGVWSSVLRVVNTNKFDLAVTASVQDFRPDGETGNALLGERGGPNDRHLMSGWFTLPEGEIVIPRGTTGEIPFTIAVPEDASPGGHYAAIIVATRPGQLDGGSGAGISSGVTSLFFLRVPGDVVEEGAIRDFYAEKSIAQSPSARFALRFENTGNVHLVPEGTIVITNMWGKERGRIDINKVNTFGNVLPESTRKFEFVWEGEPSIFEFGRYEAVATLVFGEQSRQTVYRTTYLWVIPWKQVLPIFLSLALFVWFVTWSVRRYVKKALELERERLGLSSRDDAPVSHARSVAAPAFPKDKEPRVTLAVLRRPLVEESLDLRSAHTPSARVSQRDGVHVARKSWLVRNRAVVAFAIIFAIGLGMIGWYFVEVFRAERAYYMEQVKGK